MGKINISAEPLSKSYKRPHFCWKLLSLNSGLSPERWIEVKFLRLKLAISEIFILPTNQAELCIHKKWHTRIEICFNSNSKNEIFFVSWYLKKNPFISVSWFSGLKGKTVSWKMETVSYFVNYDILIRNPVLIFSTEAIAFWCFVGFPSLLGLLWLFTVVILI